MFKKLIPLLICGWAFSCGPNDAHAIDFSVMRNGTVEIINSDSIGSGVVIAKDRVLTAAHVVEGQTTVLVAIRGNGMDVGGVVLKRDKEQDYAVIKVPTGSIVPMPLDCRKPVYGEALAVIGFPLGLPWLLTQGFVASDEAVHMKDDGKGEFIFIDVLINHGNSGGPVFDSKGAVIGIAVATLSPPKDMEGTAIGVMSPLFKFCEALKGL